MARILSSSDWDNDLLLSFVMREFAFGVGRSSEPFLATMEAREVVPGMGRIARAELDRRGRMEAESDPVDPAAARNRAFLEADRATVEGMLARLPASRIIDRAGLEGRRDEIREELARMDVES
jgi:hypothetical protein